MHAERVLDLLLDSMRAVKQRKAAEPRLLYIYQNLIARLSVAPLQYINNHSIAVHDVYRLQCESLQFGIFQVCLNVFDMFTRKIWTITSHFYYYHSSLSATLSVQSVCLSVHLSIYLSVCLVASWFIAVLIISDIHKALFPACLAETFTHYIEIYCCAVQAPVCVARYARALLLHSF